MGSFASSVLASTEKILDEVDMSITTTTKDLFTLVVDKSPKQPYARWSAGLLINNWFVGENTLNQSTTASVSSSGSESKARIDEIKTGTFREKDGYVSLTNSISYAYRAEKLGWPRADNARWTGTVMPYAMVQNSLTEIMGRLK